MEKWTQIWRKWDNFLHCLLTAISNAEQVAEEENTPFSEALRIELFCSADLRKKAEAWPKLFLQIIKFSVPKKARLAMKQFIAEVSNH